MLVLGPPDVRVRARSAPRVPPAALRTELVRLARKEVADPAIRRAMAFDMAVALGCGWRPDPLAPRGEWNQPWALAHDWISWQVRAWIHKVAGRFDRGAQQWVGWFHSMSLKNYAPMPGQNRTAHGETIRRGLTDGTCDCWRRQLRRTPGGGLDGCDSD